MIPRGEAIVCHDFRVIRPYPTPEQRDAECVALADRAGAECIEYGRSVLDRPLVAVRVPSPWIDAPRVLCAANLHGVELIGSRVALGLLASIADGGGPGRELRERAEVWVVPCLNPDGYARTVAQDGAGTLAELRTNAKGVDLNRNFPLLRGAKRWPIPGTGSIHCGRATFRGPAPLSEPETAALDALLTGQRFHAVVSLHSFMGTLIPALVSDRDDFETYAALCADFARAQGRWRYRRLASRRFDVAMGELEDHVHHVHRAWACCVETFPVLESVRQHVRAPSVFWRFNPRSPQAYVANDVPGVYAFFLSALRRQRPGGAGCQSGSPDSRCRRP